MQWFLVHYQGCATSPSVQFQNIPSPRKQPRPLPQPLTTTNPLSVDLPVLDVSHQRNHTLCVRVWLLSRSIVFARSVHVVASVRATE